ncbi:MAG: hypothetical protein WBN03_06275 [Desulfobacterales bacterium]
MDYRPLTQNRSVPAAKTGRWNRRVILLVCLCLLTPGLLGEPHIGQPNLWAAENIEPFESSGVIDAYRGDTIVINDTVYAVSGLVRFYTDFRQEDQASKYGFKAGVKIGFWVNAQKEVEAMWLQAQ